MYCTNCGTKRTGNFCGNCGCKFPPPIPDQAAKTVGVLEPDESPLVEDAFLADVGSSDWEEEFRYKVLLHYPEVRDMIARYSAQAQKGFTAEEFLKICDLAYKPLVGLSLSTVASIALPLNRKLGFKTGKSRIEHFSSPIGHLLVSSVCSMARRSQTLKQVHQGENGCVFEAQLPSAVWAMDGEIMITVEHAAPKTKVEAITRIHGQLFDWGLSTRVLDQLFEDLRSPLE